MSIKLDKIDKRILFELDKNSRIPDTRLAKLVGKSKESVRYRIKKLENEAIIQGFSIMIDFTKLGYQSCKMYLNIANNPERKKELMQYIKSDSRFFWLGVAQGSWNIGLTFFVKNNSEFFHLKNDLFSKFKDLILSTEIGTLVEVQSSYKTFLYNEQNSWTTIFSDYQNYELDEIEKIILRELYNNSRANVVDIALKATVSVDIIRGRLKKLDRNGIITRFYTKIDFNRLGYEFFKTFLYFKNLNDKDLKMLETYCLNNPKILHLIKQISPWDVELEIMCDSYHDYNQVISDLTRVFSSIINRVETAIMEEDNLCPSNKLIFED